MTYDCWMKKPLDGTPPCYFLFLLIGIYLVIIEEGEEARSTRDFAFQSSAHTMIIYSNNIIMILNKKTTTKQDESSQQEARSGSSVKVVVPATSQ